MTETSASTGPTLTERLYDRLTADDEVRVCKDISESACKEQPGNFVRHLTAAVGNKVGDELANARLVLPWAMGAVGGPAWAVGLLVPIREAGALLPQVFFGAWVRGLPQRKRAWALGGLAQAMAAAAMAAVLLFGADGLTAALLLLAGLAVQSGSRGLSSISSKDVLGKTIAKSRRGTVQGWAGSAASAAGLLVGGGLSWLGDAAGGGGTARPERHVLAALLGAAAMGWLVNAVAAATVREGRGDTEGGESAWQTMREGLGLLREDRAFLAFNGARLLLLASALALPYIAVLAREQSGASLRDLGFLVIASGVGGMVSSPFWGRLADRSSPAVMALGAMGAAGCCLVAAGVARFGGAMLGDGVWVYAVLYAVLVVAHNGIRLGRKTYVVDLADQDQRALYVALSNTLTGLVFLPAGALVGLLATLLGSEGLLVALAVVAVVAALMCRRLEPVSD